MSDDTPATPLTADDVDALASGYRSSQILLAAVRLGVFEALEARGPLDAGALAEAVAASRRGVAILADALAALGLLAKEEGRYRNVEVGRELLLRDSPGSKVALLHHTAKLYERWAKLADAVRDGRPVPDEAIDPRLRDDAASFAAAMHDVGRSSAGKVADAIDLSSVRRLLDLGGGPGTYALEFARRHPGLEAVVFDRPDTAEVAKGRIHDAGMAERVSVRAGDAVAGGDGGDLGGPYDFVFVSNLIHIYSADDCQRLVARCAAALDPGGRLCLKDFFLDPGGTSPTGAALFAVNMLVNTEGGGCYTLDEVDHWLTDAGLRRDQVIELTPQTRLVVAAKP